MNTFTICLCFGILALSTAKPAFQSGSVGSLSNGYSASSLPLFGQVNGNGAVSSAGFAASAPAFSSAQFGGSSQGLSGVGSARQDSSFQAFAPAAQVNFNQAGSSAGVGVGSSFGFGAGSSAAQGQAGSFQAAAGVGAGAAAGVSAGAAAGVSAGAAAGAQQQVIISKDFYIHSAPEEPEEVVSTHQAASGPARKNYRVVFIKTPSPKFTVSSAAISGALNEEKTVIYVLAKRPDLNVIQQQVAQHAQKASKPEVFFIKYKTPEEAQLAQQEIQAQYDALGGETNVSDEGVAPVHSVIGRAGSASAGAAAGVNAGAAAGAAADVNAGAAAGVNAGAAAGVKSGAGIGSGFSSGVGSASGFGFGSGFNGVGSASGAVSGVSSGNLGGSFGAFGVTNA